MHIKCKILKNFLLFEKLLKRSNTFCLERLIDYNKNFLCIIQFASKIKIKLLHTKLRKNILLLDNSSKKTI